MKILVTGATGFLGKSLVPTLAAAGHDVIAFGRNQSVGLLLQGERVVFKSGDFTNYQEIAEAATGMDAVVHAGALSTVWGKWEDFYQSNVKGTENVLKACQDKQIKRLVYVSSPSIYSGKEDRLNILEPEFDPNNQLNFYIKSKIMSEALFKDYPQVDSVILRPRGLFGVGDTSIIPRIIRVNRTIGIPLFNGGNNLVDMTCVENVAYAILLSLTSEKAVGQTYNITNGEPESFKMILEKLFHEIGEVPRFRPLSFNFAYGLASFMETFCTLFRMYKEPPLTKYTVATLAFSQTLNIDKAKIELGYQPIMTLEEGIKRYAEDYRSH